jgi:hypothetical protein
MTDGIIMTQYQYFHPYIQRFSNTFWYTNVGYKNCLMMGKAFTVSPYNEPNLKPFKRISH